MSLQVVWFKRDLRIVDHEALFRACSAGPTVCFYTIEPHYWALSNTSNRQWLFVRESLEDLAGQLAALGATLIVHQGNVLDALRSFKDEFGSFTLHSHVETGIGWTFERDKQVTAWCRANHCPWYEYAQNGVCRPIQARKAGFKAYWDLWAASPRFPVPEHATFVVSKSFQSSGLQSLAPDQWPLDVCSDSYPCTQRQTGGRKAGLAVFRDFLSNRGQAYSGSISSPLTAESGCSRLSPYLTYGCLSLKEIVQRTMVAQDKASSRPWSKSLAAFAKRLHWHCYWIQAFESACHMEYEPLVPHMAQLNRPYDQKRFDAWRTGHTGWPLVDACMRYLHHHGWINFRMRAMLVSAATHSLSLPWKPVADWLAQQFVDFEPGIHYSQIQMQSAMSGVTVLRMYNPVTQAMRLDPQGDFVRRWVPELANVSNFWIFEPWKMTPNLRQQAGWTQAFSYPVPLVDFEVSHRETKAAITELRAAHPMGAAQAFVERNTRQTSTQAASRQASPKASGTSSRDKPARARTKKQTANPAQLTLF